jgi:hypothetical protein
MGTLCDKGAACDAVTDFAEAGVAVEHFCRCGLFGVSWLSIGAGVVSPLSNPCIGTMAWFEQGRRCSPTSCSTLSRLLGCDSCTETLHMH